jgi:hypothetical protein
VVVLNARVQRQRMVELSAKVGAARAVTGHVAARRGA